MDVYVSASAESTCISSEGLCPEREADSGTEMSAVLLPARGC